MPKNARMTYSRKGNKGGGASELPKDDGKHFVPGFLGRTSGVPTAQGRTGYTEEKRLGPGGKGRKITLPSG
jgi:hypothetical protein